MLTPCIFVHQLADAEGALDSAILPLAQALNVARNLVLIEQARMGPAFGGAHALHEDVGPISLVVLTSGAGTSGSERTAHGRPPGVRNNECLAPALFRHQALLAQLSTNVTWPVTANLARPQATEIFPKSGKRSLVSSQVEHRVQEA